jgi:hypothetical protein
MGCALSNQYLFMPFITSVGSANSFGFGLSYIKKYIETLWIYVSSGNAAWATQANWYKDEQHTVAAGKLPAATNAAVLLSDATADVETWTAPESIELNGNTLTLQAHTFTTNPACAPIVTISVDITNSQGPTTSLNLVGHIQTAA